MPTQLFRSATLEIDTDFTAEDPLAFDYLGQQVGNWLFRGFTTRTSRAQYYCVVLYGLHLAEVAIQQYGYPGDDKTRSLLFERWERFWALATLESRGGTLERGDPDGMRGVRGAQAAWIGGDRALRLDYPLISRQVELGGMGAYLSSLREYGLVFKGTLRVTPLAKPFVDFFWTSKTKSSGNRYERYALKALDLERRTIPRAVSGLSLKRVGDRSRLTAVKKRPDQQERLWSILFAQAKDGSTLPISQQLVSADNDGEVVIEQILRGILRNKWGEVDSTVEQRVRAAIAFGKLSTHLLSCFDRAYGYVDSHGWIADFRHVASAAFPESESATTRNLCNAVQKASGCRKFGELKFHGPQFLSLVSKLMDAGPAEALEYLLAFHVAVQRTRRGSGAWFRREKTKLVMQVVGYGGFRKEQHFPSFKLNVVRRLLADLGRLNDD
ncbi:hypothetical protein [Mariniblastus fucicola]|nr:hypothetical protein [Mariniblastus fucicola]